MNGALDTTYNIDTFSICAYQIRMNLSRHRSFGSYNFFHFGPICACALIFRWNERIFCQLNQTTNVLNEEEEKPTQEKSERKNRQWQLLSLDNNDILFGFCVALCYLFIESKYYPIDVAVDNPIPFGLCATQFQAICSSCNL